MDEAQLIETREVALDEIEVSNRLRPASPASVASLKASIGQLKRVLAPVIVRQVRGPRLVLVGGLTRLTALRELEWPTVRADIYKCSDVWARTAEIDENLAGGELSMLEKAVFLAERKRLYEAMHPETAHGKAGANARWEHATETVSFASAIAEKTGLTDRRVRQLVALGQTIEPRAAEVLMDRAVPMTYRQLTQIAEQDGKTQCDIAELIAEGLAQTADEALEHVRKLFKPSPDQIPPEEAAFRKLSELFDRAPMAAKRRFLSHLGERHGELVAQETYAGRSKDGVQA